MYYSGGGGGGGRSGGGGGGAGGGGGGGGAGGGAAGGGAGAGGAGGTGGGAAGEQPPEEQPPVGAFRFNTNSSKLEYYDGNQWVNVTTDSPEQNTGDTRGLFMGGGYPNASSCCIDFVQVGTTGDAADFGDLTAPTNRGQMLVLGQELVGSQVITTPRSQLPINSTLNLQHSHQWRLTDFGNLRYNQK